MERLAAAILKAAEIHEASYDHEAAKTAAENEKGVDFNKFYLIPLHVACNTAAVEVGFGTRGTQPIYLLLKNSWNDSLEWAKDALK